MSTFCTAIDKDGLIQAEARNYLKDFSDMAPDIQIEETGRQLIYHINHSDEAKTILNKLSLLDRMSEIRVPSRLDRERYLKYKSLLPGNRAYALDKIEEMARNSAPTPDVLEDLLEWLKMPGKKDDILIALKNFCQNGLDIDDIDEARKANIRSALLDIAFGMSGEYEDSSKEGYISREYAFSVIELLGPNDDCVVKAKEFVFAILERGYTTGNYLMRVGKWLAKDAKIRTELLDRAEKLLLETHDKKIVNGCNSFIKSI